MSSVRTCVDGAWSECAGAVLPGAGDCTSGEDNDCDGQPDDTLDDVCRCRSPGTQPCDEHAGFDGTGSCRAGVQTCVLGASNATSDWGECTGSVAPQLADSCEVQGDDASCDGTPKGGCNCVEAPRSLAARTRTTASASAAPEPAVNGAFTPCQGAVTAARRNCSSPDDNDCDGLPDDTLDADPEPQLHLAETEARLGRLHSAARSAPACVMSCRLRVTDSRYGLLRPPRRPSTRLDRETRSAGSRSGSY